MMKPELIFLPLGGLGEIGMNLMVLECGEDALLIDCGVMFPENSDFGIDIIVPDFSYLLKIQHKIKALILTHGHEDHIGAIPFLLRKLRPKIFGSPFTLALVQSKLKEYHLPELPRFYEVNPNEKIKVGCFKIEFLEVTHSIVDNLALAIETPQGMVIHTSDFKLEKKDALQKFREYGKKEVLLLLSDSTNVERKGTSLPENEIQKELFKICEKVQGRIIFSVFATHIRRIEEMLEIALKLHRRVIISGRTLETNVPLAMELGFISHEAAKALIDIREMSRYRLNQLMVICTGSQAEERSALWRMAIGEHRQIKIKEGDTVILSSKFIPGNEKAISDLLNNIYRRGANAFYETIAEVHTSGHAHQDELKAMIQAVKPKFFIPIHGEYRHLVHHGELAKTLGIPQKNIFICENGEGVLFKHEIAAKLSPIDQHEIFIERDGNRNIPELVLKERRQMAYRGVVVVIFICHRRKIIDLVPHIFIKGLIAEEKNQDVSKEAQDYLRRILKKRSFSHKEDLEEEIHFQIRRFFKHKLGKKPLVNTLILDKDSP